MFHKGIRRRRFVAYAPAEPEASSFDSLSELARIATTFEPVRYEPDDRARTRARNLGRSRGTASREIFRATSSLEYAQSPKLRLARKFFISAVTRRRPGFTSTEKLQRRLVPNQEAIHWKDSAMTASLEARSEKPALIDRTQSARRSFYSR